MFDGLIVPLLKDDKPPFELEPVYPGRALKMLEVLELSEWKDVFVPVAGDEHERTGLKT